MPQGPKGQRRPADVVSNAIKVARIATGEEDEEPQVHPPHQRLQQEASEPRLRARAVLHVLQLHPHA
jgi:hypothetical protein